MKQHTLDFKKAIRRIGREIDNVIIVNNVEYRDELFSVTPSFQGGILKSVMKQLVIESSIPFEKGTYLQYKFGLKVDGQYEYLDYGFYIVYDVEKKEDAKTYTITCYDRMLYTMKDYEAVPATFPMTVSDYIKELCVQLGIIFANDGMPFANYDRVIQSDLYEGLGYTYRDIFDELAEVTASTICINADEELEIRYTDIYAEKNMLDLSQGFKKGYINANNVFVADNKVALFNQKFYVDNTQAYTFSLNASVNDIVASYYGDNDTYLGRQKVTSASQIVIQNVQNLKYVRINFNYNNSTTITENIVASLEPMLELGTTRTSYEPYIDDETIDEQYLNNVNVNFGEKYGKVNSIVLSRANESDNVYLRDEASVIANGLCEIKIKDNQIMNFNDRSDYLPDILEKLDGLQFYLCDFVSKGIMYLELCDRYKVQIGDNKYLCLMFNDEQVIQSGITENIYTDRPEKSETDYTKADETDRRLNATYSIVDKQNQIIQQVVTNVSDQNNKISQITQTVDELNTKIQDIADITVMSESQLAFVTLDNVSESEPITLQVHPINVSISRLYPRSNLYPSSSLFSTTRIIRFIRTYESEGQTLTQNIDYELPDDLLYYDATHYDEFILQYDSDTCQVRKVCKYNADGTVGLLSSPVTTDYTYPEIRLLDGDYRVEILNYNAGYIQVRCLTNNIYTEEFATKVVMRSEIDQTATQIMSTVAEEYATKGEAQSLSTRIKQTAKSIELIATDNQTSAGITIRLRNEDGTQIDTKSANITMSGLVKFTDLSNAGSTTINGANITTGIIKSANYSAGTSGTSINLVNGTIDTKGFKVSSNGSMTSTAGTIGGWSISSNALYTSGNNFYLGTSGITASIGGTSRSGIIFKAGSNFGVNSSGNLYCNNAVMNNLTATNGSFSNCDIAGCDITSSCDVSAQAVSGVLNTSTIPNISAGKITSGTLSGDVLEGVDAHFGSLSCSDFDTNTAGAYNFEVYPGGSFSVSNWGTGKYYNVPVADSITVDGSGRVIGQHWVRLRFAGGILFDVQDEW